MTTTRSGSRCSSSSPSKAVRFQTRVVAAITTTEVLNVAQTVVLVVAVLVSVYSLWLADRNRRNDRKRRGLEGLYTAVVDLEVAAAGAKGNPVGEAWNDFHSAHRRLKALTQLADAKRLHQTELMTRSDSVDPALVIQQSESAKLELATLLAGLD